MASPGYLESILSELPAAIKKPMQNFVRAAFSQLRFGAPTDAKEAAENFGGHLVPFTTSSTVDGEVAVAHQLERIPRMLIPILSLDTVNATMPTLTVTQPADETYFYVSSPTVGAYTHVYVE